jgi:RNA polymerase sigma-19 factor, ECF subfamily
MPPPSRPEKPDELTQAVSRLVVQYGHRLRRFIAGRSRVPHSEQDLAQEVYLRLLRFPAREVIDNPAAYLYRVAANVVHDFNLRQQSERIRFDSAALEELASHTAEVWSDALGDDLSVAQEVDRLVGQLPPHLKAVLLLCKREGRSYEEVARVLGVSTSTVKKHLADAIALCRVWAEREFKENPA